MIWDAKPAPRLFRIVISRMFLLPLLLKYVGYPPLSCGAGIEIFSIGFLVVTFFQTTLYWMLFFVSPPPFDVHMKVFVGPKHNLCCYEIQMKSTPMTLKHWKGFEKAPISMLVLLRLALVIAIFRETAQSILRFYFAFKVELQIFHKFFNATPSTEKSQERRKVPSIRSTNHW